MKSTNLLVVCPSYDQRLYTQTAFSIVETIVMLREMKVPVTLRYLAGDAIVNRVRNGAVAEFLARKDATHLLFVDSDMQFSPRTVLRLLKADVPFACAAYAKKTYRNLPTRTVQPRDLKGFQEASMVWNVVLHDPEAREEGTYPRDVRGGFARAIRVGAGLILLRRDMIEKMTARYPELRYSPGMPGYETPGLAGKFYGLFDPYIREGTFVGEDYAFCDRWTEGCGGEIWCDIEAEVGHWGSHEYVGRLADALALHRNARRQELRTA
jgi:hypothetical protein